MSRNASEPLKKSCDARCPRRLYPCGVAKPEEPSTAEQPPRGHVLRDGVRVVRDEHPRQEDTFPRRTLRSAHRLSTTGGHVFVAVCLALVVAGFITAALGVSRAAIYLALAAVCIFIIAFADALGGTIGWGGSKGPRVDVATPDWLVRFVGWVLLLLLSAGLLFMAWSS
jgi:hypothetical protein